jgi:hypothetical protein
MLQSSPQAKVNPVCRAPVSCQSSHININDTETEEDSDSGSAGAGQSSYMEEWKLYLTINEDILEGMDIVCRWGVSLLFYLAVQSTNTCVHLAEWFLISNMVLTCT